MDVSRTGLEGARLCLSNAALPWHWLSLLAAEPTPLKCSSSPDPTNSGAGVMSHRLLCQGPLKLCSQLTDPAASAYSAQPL